MSKRAHTNLDLERRLVEVALAGTAVAVWRGSHDAFMMPKLTVLAIVAVGLVAVGIWRIFERSEIRVPRTPAVYALAAFLTLGAVSVATSDASWRSLYGAYGRAGGFALYLGSAIVFLAVLRSVTTSTVPRVLRAILAGAGIVAGYGLLQAVGLDPWTWVLAFGPDAATSTLGNTNFVAGYIGAVLPLAVWVGLTARGRVRWAGVAASFAFVAVIAITKAQQGVIAAAGGLAVLGAAVILERAGARAKVLLGGLAALSVVGVAAIVLGLAGTGPFSRLNDNSFDYRRDYWAAAIEMTTDDPLGGVGFDRWAGSYRAARSAEAAATSLENVADAPHSVPLNMFAGGGVPLGLAYLAFVATIGWTLVLGLRRTSGPDRLLLAAVGGAWLAFQVQSAVSIEIPPLAVLHFALAGLVVVLTSEVQWTTVTLAPLVAHRERHVSKKVVVVQTRARLAGAPALAIATVLGLVGLWQVVRPMRADVAVQEALATADPQRQIGHLRETLRLNPYEPEYFSIVGKQFAAQQQAEIALQYFQRALELDGRRFADVLNAARAADVTGDLVIADDLYERARELEPNSEQLTYEFAVYQVETGKVEEGLATLEALLPTWPDRTEILLEIAKAHLLSGSVADVEATYDELVRSLAADDAGTRLRLATLFLDLDDLDRAEALAEEALDITGGAASAYFAVGQVYEAQERIDEALQMYDTAAAVDRYNPAYSEAAAALRAGG